MSLKQPAKVLKTYLPKRYELRIVAEGRNRKPEVSSPDRAASIFEAFLEGKTQEHFVVLCLDSRGKAVGISTVHIGTLNMSPVGLRELFRIALTLNAASIMVAHNHPSGDPSPSPEDIEVTRKIVEAGNLLGIPCQDHIIIGEGGRFVSLYRKGYMPSD